MPNTGMLDHRAFNGRRRSEVHWMKSWPDKTGYQTLRFSRHLYGQVRRVQTDYNKTLGSRPSSSRPALNNSVCPFHTTMKPTCGYHFSRDTDNRKRRIGIPPSNLVAWRPTFSAPPTRAQTAH